MNPIFRKVYAPPRFTEVLPQVSDLSLNTFFTDNKKLGSLRCLAFCYIYAGYLLHQLRFVNYSVQSHLNWQRREL